MTDQKPPFLLALDLRDKPVVVIGSGEEARKRAQALLEAGALVSIIAPEAEAELESWARDCQLTIQVREPTLQDLAGKWLAVLADQNANWASQLGRQALQERVYFCAIDQPRWNSFSHVALVRSGSLQLGISSAGRAPAVVAGLRRELARLFSDAKLASFVERIASLRDRLEPSDRGRKLRALAAEIRLVGSLELPACPEPDGTQDDKETN